MTKLVIDLGSYSIKYLFYDEDTIVHSDLIIHNCINDSNITDILKLKQIIKELTHELEVDFLTNIKNIIVGFDFGDIIMTPHKKKMLVNGKVTEENINYIKQKPHNDNYYLLDIYDETITLDDIYTSLNPINMECLTMHYKYTGVYCSIILIKQLEIVFEDYDVEFFSGILSIQKYLDDLGEDKYILIDMGNYNSRMINYNNGKIQFKNHLQGFQYMINSIKQDYIVTSPQIDIFQHKFMILNMIKGMLPEYYSHRIFFSGAVTYIPLFEELIKHTIHLKASTLKSKERLCKNYNSDLFIKCQLLYH